MSDQRYERVSAFQVASFKAIDDSKGEFEALVSVFGNVDRGGDRVVKGAFTKSLTRWEESGDPIPVIWNHMWENPEAHIGAVEPGDALETDDGLLVKGRIDLDNPFAKQVYRLLAERRVKEFSFGYDLKDSEKKDGALELLQIDLIEVGPTLKGMNPATELLAVKALAAATEPAKGGVIRPNGPIVIGTGGPEILWAPKSSSTVTSSVVVPADLHAGEFIKAGARHSKETLASLTRIRDEVDRLIAAGSTADEPPKSDEAEALSKASDPDEDIKTRIHLLKEQLS